MEGLPQFNAGFNCDCFSASAAMPEPASLQDIPTLQPAYAGKYRRPGGTSRLSSPILYNQTKKIKISNGYSLLDFPVNFE